MNIKNLLQETLPKSRLISDAWKYDISLSNNKSSIKLVSTYRTVIAHKERFITFKAIYELGYNGEIEFHKIMIPSDQGLSCDKRQILIAEIMKELKLTKGEL